MLFLKYLSYFNLLAAAGVIIYAVIVGVQDDTTKPSDH